MLEHDPGLVQCAPLPNDRPQLERARVDRRARIAAGNRRRREIQVLHETSGNQFGGQDSSANRRDPFNAHRSHLCERVDQRMTGVDVDDNWRDPATLGERFAHSHDSARRGQEDETKLGNVVQELAIDRDTVARGDDLNRMTRLAKRLAQADKLGMPDGKDHAPTTNRGRARQHRVGQYARQPFIDDMLVGLPSTECLRIAGAGIAIERLHEDQMTGRQSLRQRRQIERTVEEELGPGRPDGEHPVEWPFQLGAVGRELRCRRRVRFAIDEGSEAADDLAGHATRSSSHC
jgi:hypothetical protein